MTRDERRALPSTSPLTVRVLSIRQPWAWAILHAGKDVENRRWQTPHRGLIGVHAGNHTAPAARQQLAAMGFDVPDDLTTGAVLGVVRLVDCVRDSTSPWAIPGQFHWILADPQQLARPVPCRGSLQLWRAPAEVADQVLAQLDLSLYQ